MAANKTYFVGPSTSKLSAKKSSIAKMSGEERIWIRYRWDAVPVQENLKLTKLMNDFSSQILGRELQLFKTDYLHIIALFPNRRYRFVALDLNCERDEADVNNIPFRCFEAKYSGKEEEQG
jgi:hypothetical protein